MYKVSDETRDMNITQSYPYAKFALGRIDKTQYTADDGLHSPCWITTESPQNLLISLLKLILYWMQTIFAYVAIYDANL